MLSPHRMVCCCRQISCQGTGTLKAVFGDKWKTAFEHQVDYTEQGRGRKRKAVFTSATVARLRRQKPKLAFLADKRG